MNEMRRFAFLAFVAMMTLLAGCATPVPLTKEEATPKLYATSDSVALAVIEARPYVLSGNKKPQYEGLIRGGYGIPTTVYRTRPEGERFVDQFANMVRDGFVQQGVKVSVVPMPLG